MLPLHPDYIEEAREALKVWKLREPRYPYQLFESPYGKIRIRKRNPDPDFPISIVAPHGGMIEIGTSELLHQLIHLVNVGSFELASTFWTGYDDWHALCGLAGPHPHHLSSTRLLKKGRAKLRIVPVLRRSRMVVTLHACREMNIEGVMLGGGNSQARAIFAQVFEKRGISIIPTRAKLHGVHRLNVCNRAGDLCRDALSRWETETGFTSKIPEKSSFPGTGVQLECTRLLLKKVRGTDEYPADYTLAEAIAEAINVIYHSELVS